MGSRFKREETEEEEEEEGGGGGGRRRGEGEVGRRERREGRRDALLSPSAAQ